MSPKPGGNVDRQTTHGLSGVRRGLVRPSPFQIQGSSPQVLLVARNEYWSNNWRATNRANGPSSPALPFSSAE